MRNAFALAFPQPMDDRVEAEALKKWLAKRDEVLTEWTRLYTAECDKRKATAGTLWAAFNAVTEWHDHERGRFEAVADSTARVHSNLFGVSHVAKTKTLRAALELV
jgi:hypothetical protein